jgi:hypothetical protein
MLGERAFEGAQKSPFAAATANGAAKRAAVDQTRIRPYRGAVADHFRSGVKTLSAQNFALERGDELARG